MASWDKEDKEDSEDKGAKGAEGHKARVMLDTNVLIAGSGWPRWQREVLLAGLRGDKQLVVSPYVLDETRRVIAMRFPQRLQRLEDFLAQAPIEIVPDPSQEEVDANVQLARDKADVPVVLAAINARVNYLVSEDKDLTAHDDTTERLRAKLTVFLPGTFLRQVLGWSSDELEQVRGRRWQDMDAGEIT